MTALATWKHRGTLYTEGNDTEEVTTDATPRKIANIVTKGVESGLAVDAANGKITVANAGDYMVICSVSFSGELSKTFNVTIYKNTTSTNLTLERKLGTSGDIGSAGVSGIVTCVANDEISLYHSSTDGGTSFKVTDAQLSVVRLS